MSVFGGQSYKEIVQLALRAEKLTSESMSRENFQKRKGFGFVPRQSSKKSRSFESSGIHLDSKPVQSAPLRLSNPIAI